MNDVWSKFVQGTNTLYYSRKLRFDDRFASGYKAAYALDDERRLKILEIGCGPGALSAALKRWYPNAEICGMDRDSEFIKFASENIEGVRFLEGDIINLPFDDEIFDAVISNTVSEHVAPDDFYKEQMRVLKKGGKCIVMSSRRGYNYSCECVKKNDFENAFWEKASKFDDSMEKYAVGKYAVSEREMALQMEKYGFINVNTAFQTVNLAPDLNAYSEDFAKEIINANRYNDIDALKSVQDTMPGVFTEDELREMGERIKYKYDQRIQKYLAGDKQWDMNVSVIMIVTGEKK
ncbi:MAG: class I SAM-dependent methyltransferase [Clostridia bacterium]|nr:class I SAM-dependent methyltransferase [Clostridia bacterium]MBQ4159150.1 class I SAM-dependent methyltransferase [Clostridia bacterium]